MTRSTNGGRCMAGGEVVTIVVTIARHLRNPLTTQPALSPSRPLPVSPMTENGNLTLRAGVPQPRADPFRLRVRCGRRPHSTRPSTQKRWQDFSTQLTAHPKTRLASWHLTYPPLVLTNPGIPTRSSPAPNTVANLKPIELASSSPAAIPRPTLPPHPPPPYQPDPSPRVKNPKSSNRSSSRGVKRSSGCQAKTHRHRHRHLDRCAWSARPPRVPSSPGPVAVSVYARTAGSAWR